MAAPEQASPAKSRKESNWQFKFVAAVISLGVLAILARLLGLV